MSSFEVHDPAICQTCNNPCSAAQAAAHHEAVAAMASPLPLRRVRSSGEISGTLTGPRSRPRRVSFAEYPVLQREDWMETVSEQPGLQQAMVYPKGGVTQYPDWVVGLSEGAGSHRLTAVNLRRMRASLRRDNPRRRHRRNGSQGTSLASSCRGRPSSTTCARDEADGLSDSDEGLEWHESWAEYSDRIRREGVSWGRAVDTMWTNMLYFSPFNNSPIAFAGPVYFDGCCEGCGQIQDCAECIEWMFSPAAEHPFGNQY